MTLLLIYPALKISFCQDSSMGSKAEKKIVIVGKYCVGKTALVNRFTKNKFNEISPYQPTIGAAFVAKQVTVGHGKSVTLGIWDTAGSERFESLTPLYYRGAVAAIVCYDLTEESSFDKAKFYINELRENNPDCRVYLCGTKCDLISAGEQHREVSYDKVMEYGRSINVATVIETSSKTGQNVGELFLRIAKDLLEDISPGDLEKSSDKFGLEDTWQNGLRGIPCGCKR